MNVTEKRIVVNGQRIVYLRRSFPPELCFLRIAFRVGSRYDTTWGIAHFLEHMLFKGTTNRNWDEINGELASLGAYINAETSREHTVFYITVLRENLEKAAAVLGDLLINSTFPAKELAKEKQVVHNEIDRSLDSIPSYGFDRAQAHYFDEDLGHPILGTHETLDQIDRQGLADFSRRFLTKQNSVVAAVGDISLKQVKQIVRTCFPLPEGKRSFPLRRQVFSPRRVTESRANMQSATVDFRWEGLPMRHKDNAAMEVLRMALGGGMNSVFHREIREKRALAYGIQVRARYFQDTGYFSVTSQVDQGSVSKYQRAVSKVVRDFLSTGLTPKDFASVKNQLKLAIRQDEESGFFLSSIHCIRYLFHLPGFDNFARRITAVRRKDVEQIARKTLSTKPFLFIMLPE